jgi:hypothetical protein
MLGDDVGRDEYIDQKHGRFREIEAAGRSGAGFGALSTNTGKKALWRGIGHPRLVASSGTLAGTSVCNPLRGAQSRCDN